MDNIIAGNPAPTNPQAESAVRSLMNGGFNEQHAREIIARVQGEARERGYWQGRSQALAEAIKAARSEYLTDSTGTDEDNAYNNGIADAVAAINMLTDGGAR